MICQVLNISKVEVSDDHPKKGSDIYDQLLSRKGGLKSFLGTIFWLGSKVFFSNLSQNLLLLRL